MSAAAKGYPMARTAVRNARPSRLLPAVANDNWVINANRDYSRFLKAPVLETVGKRAAAKAAAGRVLPVVGEALLALDYWSIVTTIALARDPAVREDNALSFPPNWTVTNVGSLAPVFVHDGAYDTGETKWIKTTNGVHPESQRNPGGWEIVLPYWDEVPSADLVAGTVPTTFTEFHWQTRFDAQPDYFGDGSTGIRSRQIATKTAAGPNPTYANPPRTETITRIVPVPAPAVRPEPFHRTSEEPGPNSERGPLPEPIVEIPPLGWPGPRVSPGPVPPTTIITLPEPGTGGNPAPETVVVSRPNPRPDPARRREDDRKARVHRGGLAGAFTAVGVVTEALDIMNAAWDALPKSCKPGYYELRYRDKKTGEIKTYWKRRWRANIRQRFAAIRKCADHMDLEQFVKNLVKQNLSDMAWAKLGQKAGEAGAAAGMNRGWQFGPWDTFSSETFNKWLREQNDKKEWEEFLKAKEAEELRKWYKRSAKAARKQRRAMHKAAMAEARRQRAHRVRAPRQEFTVVNGVRVWRTSTNKRKRKRA